MGSTALGDLTTGAVGAIAVSHASVASNGANALILNIGALNNRAPQNITIVSALWEPTGADSAVTNTSSYRTIRIVNGASDGLGTTVLASLANNTSQGSNTQKAMVLAATPSLSTGQVICASHLTVGGAETNGTVLVAGNFRVYYRPI